MKEIKTLENKRLSRIYGNDRGSVFSKKDFTHVGDPAFPYSTCWPDYSKVALNRPVAVMKGGTTGIKGGLRNYSYPW